MLDSIVAWVAAGAIVAGLGGVASVLRALWQKGEAQYGERLRDFEQQRRRVEAHLGQRPTKQ